jgi:uncharacterized protein YacL
MLLSLIRALFILITAGLGVRLAKAAASSTYWSLLFSGVVLLSVLVVVVDLLVPRKRIQTISAIYFGMIVGLILSYFLQIAVEPVLTLLFEKTPAAGDVPSVVTGLLTAIVCYVCVSILLQTKDDFRFIIPYMEFSKEVKGTHPLILDTSVIIDGRIADVAEARILDQPLVVPRFVLQELQGIADSSDRLRRNRGRRGLDILNKLQKSGSIEVKIDSTETPELMQATAVDQKLLVLAKHMGGKVVTNDYNLNKIAKLQGVEVINLNDLANALKPIVLPGEAMTVKLIKRGEEPGQGIGYLDDGTMVVAEQGAHHLGETIRLMVTSVLQTSAGRMIFGRIEGTPPPPGSSRAAQGEVMSRNSPPTPSGSHDLPGRGQGQGGERA